MAGNRNDAPISVSIPKATYDKAVYDSLPEDKKSVEDSLRRTRERQIRQITDAMRERKLQEEHDQLIREERARDFRNGVMADTIRNHNRMMYQINPARVAADFATGDLLLGALAAGGRYVKGAIGDAIDDSLSLGTREFRNVGRSPNANVARKVSDIRARVAKNTEEGLKRIQGETARRTEAYYMAHPEELPPTGELMIARATGTSNSRNVLDTGRSKDTSMLMTSASHPNGVRGNVNPLKYDKDKVAGVMDVNGHRTPSGNSYPIIYGLDKDELVWQRAHGYGKDYIGLDLDLWTPDHADSVRALKRGITRDEMMRDWVNGISKGDAGKRVETAGFRLDGNGSIKGDGVRSLVDPDIIPDGLAPVSRGLGKASWYDFTEVPYSEWYRSGTLKMLGDHGALKGAVRPIPENAWQLENAIAEGAEYARHGVPVKYFGPRSIRELDNVPSRTWYMESHSPMSFSTDDVTPPVMRSLGLKPKDGSRYLTYGVENEASDGMWRYRFYQDNLKPLEKTMRALGEMRRWDSVRGTPRGDMIAKSVADNSEYYGRLLNRYGIGSEPLDMQGYHDAMKRVWGDYVGNFGYTMKELDDAILKNADLWRKSVNMSSFGNLGDAMRWLGKDIRFRQDAKGGETSAEGDTETDVPEETDVPTDTVDPSGPRIVINPTTFKNQKDALCVAWNEGIRVYMEANGVEPQSEPTEKQRKFFSDTPYADDELQLRRTILARIATLDTSVKDPTDDQLRETVQVLNGIVESGFARTDDEIDKCRRLAEVVGSAIGADENVPPDLKPREPAAEEVSEDAVGAIGGGMTFDEKELEEQGLSVNENFGRDISELEDEAERARAAQPAADKAMTDAEKWEEFNRFRTSRASSGHSQDGVTEDGFKKGVEIPLEPGTDTGRTDDHSAAADGTQDGPSSEPVSAVSAETGIASTSLTGTGSASKSLTGTGSASKSLTKLKPNGTADGPSPVDATSITGEGASGYVMSMGDFGIRTPRAAPVLAPLRRKPHRS